MEHTLTCNDTELENEFNDFYKLHCKDQEICYMILFCIEKYFIKNKSKMQEINKKEGKSLETPLQQLQYIAAVKICIANKEFFEQKFCLVFSFFFFCFCFLFVLYDCFGLCI